MALKPWYKVVEPRGDLREGRPLDASEFAVHLDKVRKLGACHPFSTFSCFTHTQAARTM